MNCGWTQGQNRGHSGALCPGPRDKMDNENWVGTVATSVLVENGYGLNFAPNEIERNHFGIRKLQNGFMFQNAHSAILPIR